LNIVTSQAGRIRTNSRAKIDAKGLLGDKLVTITPGTADHAVLKAGETIPTDNDPQDLSSALQRVGSISSKTEQIVDNLAKISTQFVEGNIAGDIKGSAESLNHLLASADTGNGYVAKLLKDPTEAQRISNTISLPCR
jgi:phospholipid/cholesterol/gamma-HCH transport system substrate-binding protein